MQSAQNQMARQRGLDGNLSGFDVSNFPYHNDIRILPENVTKAVGKGKIDLRLDLHLPDAGEPILYRVFNGKKVSVFTVELAQGGIESGGLAASGGARKQNDPVCQSNQIPQVAEPLRIEAPAVQPQSTAALVQQPQYDPLAAGGR